MVMIEAPGQDPILDRDLTTEEQNLLTALLAPEISVEIKIPDDAPSDLLERQVDVLLKSFHRIRAAQSRIKTLIGRALLVVRGRPEIWKRNGCAKWSEYITRILPDEIGISRPELYQAAAVAERLPGISLERAGNIGWENLKLAAKAVKTNPARTEEWLQKAATMTGNELRNAIAIETSCEVGDLDKEAITFVVTKTVAARLREFMANKFITAYVGEGESLKLEAMMDECQLEWETRGRQMMEQHR